ncbi:putative periplasmic lipoprotein [Zophobihabitans entericus]|uniref:Gliding motility-associated lipoprotein GldD n=1 Tax=Zophobihabitans entericus TaxID=1635327 RepID=A0A6G9I8B0_9GAMM|nr:hypothetical protein [Zophobihabitans entericus]QIQ20446.1 hypothetical protein IPMB12_01375 [Zophobihabitans entericus]
MKRLFALFFFALMLTGCATPKGDRMDTNVTFYNYNSYSKGYYKEKTFLLYFENNGKPYLSYQAESSASDSWFKLSVNQEQAATIISIIDKYFEWEAIAARDKDMINIEITSGLALQDWDYKFSFSVISHTPESHVLKMDQCGTQFFAQVCQYTHPIMYVGTYDAKILKQELQKFIAGKFQAVNYNKYN